MAETIINSSLIKAIIHHGNFREDQCMKKVKALFFGKTKSIPSPVQSYGLYFETKAIGGSARNQKTEILPLTSRGKITAIQERIDQQIDIFRLQLLENYINVVSGINTQVQVFKRINQDLIVSATYDIFPSPILYKNQILPVSAIDLKITKDIDSDWGEFGWGNFENMDHTQLVLQNFIVRDFDEDLNARLNPKLIQMNLIRPIMKEYLDNLPVFYWVFEYGTKLRNQLYRVNVDNLMIMELKETIRKVDVIIWEQNQRIGWNANPSYDNCQFCPLNFMNGGTCREATIIKEI